MLVGLRHQLLPESQRRTVDEVTESLDLRVGDSRSKQSAFWTMLTLSAVIAAAGVNADSTATVIGAMIIAPLSTPIMGVALGVVKRARTGAVGFVAAGAVLVVVVGVVSSAGVPGTYDLLDNSQIASRTSPGLVDLVAALATGLAGAVALARRDLASVLPGVAIAISLVPPLAVAGVCLGRAAWELALGALVLFLSNLVALVLAGVLVFAVLGYADAAAGVVAGARRRARVTLGALGLLVVLPLAANSVATYTLAAWTETVRTTAREWASQVPDASLEGVDVVSRTFHVRVQTPGDVPPVDDLVRELEDHLPDGVGIVVETSYGKQVDAGHTGGD
jgi:uncharacterized hydrophobic protein (TIGR00271 family)